MSSDTNSPSWDDMAPPPKGGGGKGKNPQGEVSLFMKLVPREEPYHVRLACTPIKFRKHGWAFRSLRQWPISPALKPEEKDLDVAWKEGYFMPSLKYAAFVFDRETNRLRIIEGNQDVFGPFYNQYAATKVEPHSPDKGWDWIIIVSEEEGLVDGKSTRVRKYVVTLDTGKGVTPLTDEERKTLENPKFQRSELETRYFPRATSEHIKELWLQLPEALRRNPKRGEKGKASGAAAAPAAAPAAPKQAAAPAAPKQAAAPAAAPATVAKPAEKVPEPPAETSDNSFLADEPAADAGDDQGGDEQEAARLF